MRKRPEGPRYRHLARVGNRIYYERRGKPGPDDPRRRARVRLSCETDDWDVAAAWRDEYERRKGITDGVPFFTLEAPKFRDFAARYLAEDTTHIAGTTKRDRESQLREDGPLLRFFGECRLDEITAPLLRQWWGVEIQRPGRATKTGRAYLDALAAVFTYAKELGLVERSPAPDFRETLRRWGRTKQGRAASQPGLHIRPRGARRGGEPAHRIGSGRGTRSRRVGAALSRCGPPPGRSAGTPVGRHRLGKGG